MILVVGIEIMINVNNNLETVQIAEWLVGMVVGFMMHTKHD